MSFDIYGNRLERGFCEVHPHVRQEYPCDLCMNERQRQTVRASYPKCGICGKFESCADSCGVPVCSEGCAHEAERRSGEADGLRAELAAERERADIAEAERDVLRSNQLGPVPEGPLKALGAWVADHTDDDTWPAAERYLNAALAELTAERERAERCRNSVVEACVEYPNVGEYIAQVEAERDALRERADRAEAEAEAVRALLRWPGDFCLSCGGDGGHEEACRGTTGLLALQAQRDELRERVARLVGAIACAKDLTTIMRMPNVEYVADAHNAAVATLRAALEGK